MYHYDKLKRGVLYPEPNDSKFLGDAAIGGLVNELDKLRATREKGGASVVNQNPPGRPGENTSVIHGSRATAPSNLPDPTSFQLDLASGIKSMNFVNYALIPIIPDLLAQSHVNPDHYQEWTTIILGLWAFVRAVSGTLISIVANDIHNMRKSTLISLGLMAVSAPPMFVCSGIGQLVFARGLHGAASAAITISSMFLVSVQVPRQDNGAAMGWVALAMTLGCLFGSATGGPLYQYAGGVGIVVISEVLLLSSGYLTIYESKRYKRSAATVDHSSQELAQASADTERTKDKPLLSFLGHRMRIYSSAFLFLIRQRKVITMLFSMTIPCVCMACLEAVLPSFMKKSFGWSQTQMSSVWFLQSFPQLASPLVGKLVDRHGTRLNFCIGFTATALALTCMALVHHNSIVEVGIFGTMIVVMNVGTLLVVVPSMASISKSMDLATEQGQSEPGTAVAQFSGLLNLAMTVPGMVGPTWGNVAMKIGGWPILCLSLASLNAVGWLTIPSRKTRDTLEINEISDET
ncbi:hypothetical protein N7476_006158 [Penicillium atrosanguineum]|uniref:Major facilitator superfamily (MFS) profile domain-containing protein n=1 Tax=Penicillium atrosanguineum TaxID=1132637 RepID=A0A9W9PWM4_9EURO|nr:hypothetical protein N7476_006158 [Penicillium atrosanguineum]